MFVLIGLPLNLLFLYNVTPKNGQFDCCNFSCSPCCNCKATIEYAIYKPNNPTKSFTLRLNANGSEEIRPEMDPEDHFEMTEDEEETSKQEEERHVDQQAQDQAERKIQEQNEHETEREELFHEGEAWVKCDLVLQIKGWFKKYLCS